MSSDFLAVATGLPERLTANQNPKQTFGSFHFLLFADGLDLDWPLGISFYSDFPTQHALLLALFWRLWT